MAPGSEGTLCLRLHSRVRVTAHRLGFGRGFGPDRARIGGTDDRVPTVYRRNTILGLSILATAACGPKVEVAIVATSVELARAATREDSGLERFLPKKPPRPFVLSGGPASFEGEELRKYLSDKRGLDSDPSGWAEKVKGLVTAEYAPRQVKLAVVGHGGADKGQVQHMVQQLLRLGKRPAADEADALAVAICHAHTDAVSQRLAQGQRAASSPARPRELRR